MSTIVRVSTRLPGAFSVALYLFLTLGLAIAGAVPLVVAADGSGGQAGLTITMTGETGETEFDLTASSAHGGWVEVPGEGVFTYIAGTVVDLKAIAADGFRFVEWTGDTGSIVDVESAETTITVDADYSITATFEEEPVAPAPRGQHILVVTSTGGGNVTVPGEGAFAYDGGTEVDLVAEPAEGYRFSEWTGDVSTVTDVTSGVTSIIMEGNYHIVAGFDSVALSDSSAFAWWWIVVGIVIAGLLAYFLRWRRRTRTADSTEQE